QAVYALRQDLGDEEAIGGGKELRLDLARISTDLHDFKSARSREAWTEAVAAYRGPFLDDFHLPAAEEVERWADDERRVLAREYNEIVQRLAAIAEREQDFLGTVD